MGFSRFVSIAAALALANSSFAQSPLEVLLEDFEGGSTAGAAPVTMSNSSAGGASNTTIANVIETGSRRLRLTDSDGGHNGAVMTVNGAFQFPGYYLVTAKVKVDNPSPLATFGMAVRVGGTATPKISDTNAGYVMNLAGTNDGGKGYQTIGAAIEVPTGGSWPKNLTIYFGTDPSSNTYNAPAADGDFNGTHRSTASTWPASTSNAVYIDDLKLIGPGNFGEERHLWISIGDSYTNLTTLNNRITAAANNNFNAIDILARYRADAYYVPNRTDSTYPNPEPMGTKVAGIPVTPENDPLQFAIDRGRQLGMRVYASFSCFLVSENNTYPSYMPSGSIMWFYNGGSPRAMVSSDASAEGIWADVGRADVRQYHKNIVMDIVRNYDIDGIIFDRIRYPSNQYSYNPQALSEMGLSGTPAPTNATFRLKRQEAVTQFLAECYEAATTEKPWMIVGTVPIAYGSGLADTYNGVFQAWPQWSARTTNNRAISFGVQDLCQPQFYRLWNSTSPHQAPGANNILMDKARFGDTATLASDLGLMPGGITALAPLFFHPNSGDTNQSNANSENIVQSRNKRMNGWGLYAATQTLADINLIRSTSANSAGVDVLAQPSVKTDFLFKKNYDPHPPLPPTNFAGTVQSDGKVSLTWTPSAVAADGDAATKYYIWKSTTNPVPQYRENLVTLGTIPGNASSFVAPRGVAGTYYFRIAAVDDYNNWSSGVQIGPFTLPGNPADIIVDNPAAAFAGTWTAATSAADKYGADYRYASAGSGSKTATFSVTIPADGLYNVYEWHAAGSNRATNARHIVTYDAGSQTVQMNQTINGGRFNLLGQYPFRAGQTYSVTINDIFSGSIVIADAIKWSFAGPLPAPPEAPSNLGATAVSASQINLTWTDNSLWETNFVVSRATASGGPYTDIATLPSNATSFNNTGLAASTTYWYRVRATNSHGASANSNTASATTNPPPPPNAPSNLSATAASSTQINLTWTDNSNNETNFIVSRATASGGPFTDVATLGANITSFNNTGLSAATTYWYRVRATNAGGASANSNTASATTQPPGAIIVDNPAATFAGSWTVATSATDKYGADYRYVGSGTGTRTATYSVTIPGDGLYNVHEWHSQGSNRTTQARHIVSYDGGSQTVLMNQQINGGQWNLVGQYPFRAGQTYTVVLDDIHPDTIIIADAIRWSYVGPLPTPPAAPSGLGATAVSQTQINLAWTDNSNNETNFVVSRATASGGPYTDIATLGANITSFNNTGLTAGTTYWYRVRATNSAGASANSNTASATAWPNPVVVDNPAATFAGSWTTATSATDKYGTDYRFASPGTGSKTATYTITIPVTGTYRVQEWHSQGTNRTTNGRHTVSYQGGSQTVLVNQQVNGGQWNTLGTYSFTAGQTYTVVLDDVFSGTVIIADAIRWEYVSP